MGGGAVVRDDEALTIDGVKEMWRIEWAKAPTPHCMGAEWNTCPCAGFAFGEKGAMDLVRPARAGQPEDRLRLDAFFEGKETRMAHWPVLASDSGKAPEPMDVAMRPATSIIKYADYDRDGRATEFLLQVAAGPCGHAAAIAVGISKSNGKLHALASAETPNEPVTFDRAADWAALAKKSPVDVVQVACGDHGATESTTLHVTADGQLHVKAETKKCATP